MTWWIGSILFLLIGPLAGGMVSGWDRRISARMQSRRGPPIFQPFYDVLKLWEKQDISVRRPQNLYVLFYLLLVILSGILFFAGSDLLLVSFAFTLGAVFFVLGAYTASSPYSFIGAERELIQMMAYEPMVLLTPIGMYMVTRSFSVNDISHHSALLVWMLPGVFLSFLFALEIKFRKSPFDLSASHHAHQELVGGIMTEFSGPTLALIEVTHWYEYVLLLGWVYLFFASQPIVGLIVTVMSVIGIILVDNVFARLRWQVVLRSSWIVALVLGFGNILLLSLFHHGGGR